MQRVVIILKRSPMLAAFQSVTSTTLKLIISLPPPCKSLLLIIINIIVVCYVLSFNINCSFYDVAEGFNPDDFVLPTFCFE